MSSHGTDSGNVATELDAERVRRDFPLLLLERDGKPLVYLDNAATTQKPQCVIDTVCAFYTSLNANVHRAVYRLGQSATERYEDIRSKAQRFLGARTPAEIVFTRGTTDGINLVAGSFGRSNVGPGDEVLITAMEHHSNIVPWQMLCEEKGAVLRVAPIADDGTLLLDDMARLLGEKTKLVSLVHVSNALGTVNPIERTIGLAHDAGAKVLIDGAQSAGHMPMDVASLDCDFYACSGHKMLGPTGTGLLYGRESLLEAMPPYQGGGGMVVSMTYGQSTYKAPPHKFEAGTPNIAGIMGLGAAIDYLNGAGMQRVAAYEQELCAYGTGVLESIEGLSVVGTAADRVAVWSFCMEAAHPHDIAQALDCEGIAVRAGHHCVRPVMERLGLSATTRVSLAFYNTKDELDALRGALHRIASAPGAARASGGQGLEPHGKDPSNCGELADATHKAEGHNPLCGDHFTVYLLVEDDTIADVSFTGSGCAIAKTSASAMATVLKTKTIEEARAMSARFQDFVSADLDDPFDAHALGPLVAFRYVREYPVRVKCAMLAWHTMEVALERANDIPRARRQCCATPVHTETDKETAVQ